jgi:hypothetical protein
MKENLWVVAEEDRALEACDLPRARSVQEGDARVGNLGWTFRQQSVAWPAPSSSHSVACIPTSAT